VNLENEITIIGYGSLSGGEIDLNGKGL